jgi:hypothetical protein
MEELVSKASDDIAILIAQYGLQVVGAITILILGRIAAGIGRGVVRRVLEKAKLDEAVVAFISSLFYFFVTVHSVLVDNRPLSSDCIFHVYASLRSHLPWLRCPSCRNSRDETAARGSA